MKARTESSASYICWFEDIGIEDVPLVGGKNASLGEMYRGLAAKGVKVPNGFAVTAQAYRDFLSEAGLEAILRETLQDLDTRDLADLAAEAAASVRPCWQRVCRARWSARSSRPTNG
jgi:Phosphoenolpyruvate synthase/pyruvate phosphate dikinase